MTVDQRCGTCRHYEPRTDLFGICRWRPTTTAPVPWHFHANHAIYPAEGTNCLTWEATDE